ncbi:MAG: hypothetical protein O3A57_12340, partial [Bacteroidetes bacterium]|nr:hypothetical protein [Bacteroidota bacterium]
MLRNLFAMVVAVVTLGCFPWRAPDRVPEFTTPEQAQASDAERKFLNLHDQGLTNAPAGISAIEGLTRLSLRKNTLTNPGKALSGLTDLVWLDIANMGLATFPEEINDLSALETLYAS